MQKALTQMNIQLDHVFSDLMGKTGTAILRRIVAGERDPQQLATLRDGRLRANEATVARSLHGNWRDEHLFALAQALAHYDFLGEQIRACDRLISQALGVLPKLTEQPAPEPGKPPRNPHRTGAQQKELHQALRQAAANARRSESYIGACRRARLARMDTAKASKKSPLGKGGFGLTPGRG